MLSSLYEDLLAGNAKLSLVGLGYVGMPIAVEFAKHVPVIGFDVNEANGSRRPSSTLWPCRRP